MPQVPTDNADWERQKSLIYQLYCAESKPLKEVIALMTERHGFTQTKAKYERAFKKWNWRKNLTEKEWKFVAHRIRKRGRDSEVWFQGIEIPNKKVKRETSRYDFPSTSQLFNVAYHGPESPQTPPGITVASPPAPQSPIALAVYERTLILNPLVLQWASVTPWRQFLDFVDNIHESALGNPLRSFLASIPSPTHQLEYSTSETADENYAQTALILKNVEYRLGGFLDNQHMPSITDGTESNFGHEAPGSSIRSIRPNPFLPPTNSHVSEVRVGAVFEHSQGSSLLELLKMAISLISNQNSETHETYLAVIKLFQKRRNLSLLSHLLEQKLPSVDAFAEKLLAPAVLAGNMDLVMMLIANGVPVDSKSPTVITVGHISGLESAIMTGRGHIVRYLLDHGADPHLKSWGWNHVPMLDVAARGKYVGVVEEILRPRPQFLRPTPVITVQTLCEAIAGRNPDILRMLMRRITSFRSYRKEQWRIMESAARRGSIQIFKYLLRRDFHINATGTDGYGSALAAASFPGEKNLEDERAEMVLFLISRGADVNGIGSMEGCWSCTPLQGSLINGRPDLAKALIQAGADPNLCGNTEIICSRVAPIKLASLVGDVLTVKLLLQEGAELNTTFTKDHSIHHRQSREQLPLPETFPARCSLQLRPYDVNSCTALQIALESGSLTISRILLENGAKLPSRDSSESWDPLVSAFIGGEQQVIELVLARMGSAPSTQEYIQACIKLGKCAPIKKLIEEGLIRIGGDASRPELICTAIFENDTDFSRSLLFGTIESFGCMPIAYGAAALVAAVYMKDTNLIHTLLDAGARPCVTYEARSSSNDPHHTLLEERITAAGLRWPKSSPGYARVSGKNAFDAISGSSDLATLLIEACNGSKHASPSQHSCRRAMENAFMNSLEVEADEFSLTRSFIAAGVDINCRSSNRGCSALQMAMDKYACEKKHGDIFECLLVAGADVDCVAIEFEDISNHHGYHTPLQYAAKSNDEYLIKRFIQQGANVNASPVRSQGATALQFAAMEANFEVLNILLEAGAEINAPRSSFDGRTVIEGAAEWGRLDIVRYLLEAGADVKGKGNRQYRRSVWRAWTEGHKVLANMIQDYKVRTYGREDISSIEDIVSSMSERELERGKEDEEDEEEDEKDEEEDEKDEEEDEKYEEEDEEYEEEDDEEDEEDDRSLEARCELLLDLWFRQAKNSA